MPNRKSQNDVSGPRKEQSFALSQVHFMNVSAAISNEAIFAVSKLQVGYIWKIVKAHLAEDHRSKHVYDIVQIKRTQKQQKPEGLQSVPLAENDPWENKIISHTYALLRFPLPKEPNNEPLKPENGVALAHFEAVFTSAGFKIFGLRDENGMLRRHEEALVNGFEVDSYRIDDLSLGEIHRWVDRSLKNKSGQLTAKP